jgi:hypothetical protein
MDCEDGLAVGSVKYYFSDRLQSYILRELKAPPALLFSVVLYPQNGKKAFAFSLPTAIKP